MAVRLLFYWSSASLLAAVLFLKVFFFGLSSWLLFTLAGTRALNWVRGGDLLPFQNR